MPPPRKPPAPPGSLSRDPPAAGRPKPPQGEGGRFVSPREAAPEPAAPPAPRLPASSPAPPPFVPRNTPPPATGTTAASRGPTATQTEAIVKAVERGQFEADAFVAQGIAWKVATGWLKLGEASFNLHSEDGRPLTWQGELYKRLRAAKAGRLAPVMEKLHTQAKDNGGADATRYLEALAGGQRSASQGVRRQIGAEYQDEDPTAGADTMDDGDLLELLNTTIASALASSEYHRRISDQARGPGGDTG